MMTGGYVDPAAGRLTVAEYAVVWLDRQVHLKPSTRATYDVLMRQHVLPTFGAMPLGRVEHSAVTAWVARLSERGLSGSTVRQTHRVLHMILSSAVRDGRLSRNVAAGLSLPRVRQAEKRFLDHGQVVALAEAAAEYGVVVRTLAYCGLRFGTQGVQSGPVTASADRAGVGHRGQRADGVWDAEVSSRPVGAYTPVVGRGPGRVVRRQGSG